MDIDRNTHIAEVVATLPGAGGVLDAMGIDYSSPGERSIAEAAGLEGVDPDAVVLQLRRLPPSHQASWLDRSLAELVEFLIEQHYHLTRNDLARIAEELAELCSESPGDETLQRMREEFKALTNELLPHIHREQEEVFPLIQRLEALWQSKAAPRARENEMTQTIKELLIEHGSIGARVRLMRELRMAIESHDLSPRCRAILQSLSRLEADLCHSMFLENCVLFPRALALQESLSGSPVTRAG
jgi:regulator of cell morphogenesis and NO signaling